MWKNKRGNKKNGIRLKRKYGLIRCGGTKANKNAGCKQLLIIKDGQKSKKCHRCGTNRSLGGKEKQVLAFAKTQKKIREAMNQLRGEDKYYKLGIVDEVD